MTEKNQDTNQEVYSFCQKDLHDLSGSLKTLLKLRGDKNSLFSQSEQINFANALDITLEGVVDILVQRGIECAINQMAPKPVYAVYYAEYNEVQPEEVLLTPKTAKAEEAAKPEEAQAEEVQEAPVLVLVTEEEPISVDGDARDVSVKAIYEAPMAEAEEAAKPEEVQAEDELISLDWDAIDVSVKAIYEAPMAEAEEVSTIGNEDFAESIDDFIATADTQTPLAGIDSTNSTSVQ